MSTRPRPPGHSTWKQGDRVVTATDGPGTVVGPWLERGLRRHGDLEVGGWIVALDSGQRRIYQDLQPEPLEEIDYEVIPEPDEAEPKSE